ncbi:hypothetical protein FQZ97_943020 [compost metagenome]
MRVWRRRELDLLEVNQAIRTFDNDVIQPRRRDCLVVALKLHPGVASRRVKPIAENSEALPVLVDVTGGSDRGVLDVFRHGWTQLQKSSGHY